MNKKLLLLLLLFVFVNPIFSQIMQRGASTSARVNIDKKEDTPILTIDKPNGVQVGDILLVTIAQQDNETNKIPVSADWKLIASDDIEGGGKHAWGTILYKITTPADASVTDYSFTLGSESKKVVGAIVAFSGVDTTNPFDALGSIVRNDGKDNNVSTTAITTVSTNAAVLMFGMSKKDITWNSNTWQTTSPGSLAEIFDKQGVDNASVGLAWAIKPTPGSTGAGTVQMSSDEDKTGVILLALRPGCPSITNNNVLYSNGISGKINATPNENGTAVLSAPADTYFATVNFASYGTPTGTAPNFELSSCHATTSQSIAEAYLLGKSTATIPATNVVFTDPCVGTVKRLYVTATYAQPVCNGNSVSITGTTPSGGTGTFTYQWQSSVTSATIGFIAAAGANSGLNYTSGALTQTTWFRRVVTSCSYTSTSAVIEIRVNAVVTQGTIGSNQTICSNTTPSPLTSPTVGTGSGTITYEWQTNASGSYITIASASAATYSPPVLTGTTSYQRRTVSVSGGVTCYSPYTTPVMVTVNITAAPAAFAQTFCSGATVANLVATGTALKWYASLTGGTALVSTTALATGNYFVSQTLNSCESTRISVTVTVNTTAAPTVAVQTFCSGATVANLVATGTALKWYAASTGGTALVSTTALATGTYFVSQTLNSCESIRTAVAVTVNTTAAPTLGTRTQPTCSTATGSAVLNGLPLGSWELTRSPGNVITTGSGTSTTITGLSSGTYTYSVIGTNNGTGLKGEYFNNKDLSGSPALTRTDATVAFDWGNGTPGAPITSDNFSVRWTGQIQPLYSENYTFTTRSDDGIRLWINGTLIINNWTVHAATTNNSSPISLIAGVKYDVILEYYEAAGQAVSQLSWSSTSQLPEFIKQSQLYSVASCSSPASANVVIDAQPATPSAPLSALPTHPTCIITTGSIALSGLPTSGSWTITTTPVTPGLTGLTGTGDRTTVSGLTAGTSYTFSVSNGTCISPLSSNISINPIPLVARYNNGSWTNGPPAIEKSIIFEGNYTSIGNLEGCECTVNAGVAVTVLSGHTLKITNAVKVNTAAGTSLTFENNSSLVQVNEDPTINTGNIIYKRKSGAIRKTDYTYWSSPVAGQTLKKVSPNTPSNRFWSFDAGKNSWVQENEGNIMLRAKGYIIRGPEPFPVAGTDYIVAPFTGVPHNGEFTIAIASQGTSNLLGNPYPSALDAVSFLYENREVLQGTIYFWTHATEITKSTTTTTPGMINFVYTSDDYASYNLSGGVATTAKATGNIQLGSEVTANRPSGKIASGQGFFATALVAGNVIFKNKMRVGVDNITGTNSQFFKTTKSEKIKREIERHRVWLNLTNDQGAFKQLLVGYITDATNGYDNAFDGVNNNGNQFVNFYTINENKNLTIQGRALPFDENDIVPLGYSSVIQGVFAISIDEVDGLLTSGDVYLEDKLTTMVHDLKAKAYTFSTEKGTFNDRFVLRYTNRTLGVGDFDTAAMQVLVSVKNKQIKINSSVETIDKVFIYDVLGKQIFEKTNVDALELVIPNLVSSDQVLIVKTLLQSGQIVTTKTVY